MGLKRVIYGLRFMRPYRSFRTSQLASKHRDHPEGFMFAGSETFFRQDWETEERQVFEKQFTMADVFIDVGANQGFYTCLAARRGLQVAAVEPEVGNLRFLLSNIRANSFDVEVFPVALSKYPGIVDVFGDGDTASLVSGWAAAGEGFVQMTPANSFDNLFAGRWTNSKVFVKIDVEGFEQFVLAGASQFLARSSRAAWLIETFPTSFDSAKTPHRGFVEVFELMDRFGYQAVHAQTGEAVTVCLARSWFDEGAKANVGRSNYLFTHSLTR